MPHGRTVTISIGIADGATATETAWRALYREADKALFEAKHLGRNRFQQSSGPIDDESGGFDAARAA